MSIQLAEYRKKIAELNETESISRDLALKKINDGVLQGPLTGFSSLDKPWLKFYGEEEINQKLPRMTAYQFFCDCNKDRMADFYALNFHGRITFAELFNKISDAERAFLKAGIRKGDYVTFCTPTLPETIYAFYSLNKIGAVCNFIDLRMNKERIQRYIDITKSKLVVSFNGVSEKVYGILDDSCAELLIDIDGADLLDRKKKLLYRTLSKGRFRCNKKNTITWDKFIKTGRSLSDEEVNQIYASERLKFSGTDTEYIDKCADEPAAIVYTGGTTGEPKGAVLTNTCLNAPAFQYSIADIPRGNNDRFLGFMPPFIAYGLVDGIHLPMVLGMETVLVPKFNPDEFSKILKEYKPAHFVGIPIHLKKLMEDPDCEGLDLSFIKNAGCGGDTIPESLEIDFNEFLEKHNCKQKMRTGLGMTENAAMSIYDTNNKVTKEGRVGIPMQKMKVGVFDEDGNELGYNEKGELWINSPSIIEGYFNNPEETENVIVTVNGERWIKTKDIVEIDPDGSVKFIGRKKAMIVRPDGHNVWPDMIRDNLLWCPIIKDVCVVGVKSKHNEIGQIPTAVVVLKDSSIDKEDAKKQIFEYQSHLLGERDGISDVRFRDSLPYTPVGKIDSIKLTEEENKLLSDIDFYTITNIVKKQVNNNVTV